MKHRIDVFLQYYKPHVSGLTNMAAALAEDMVRQGNEVHVHCVAKSGPSIEYVESGVTVHAYRRNFSLGRGNFSSGFLRAAWRVRKKPGTTHFHLPLPESGLLGWILRRRPSVVTYQCDAPSGGVTMSLMARALDISHRSLIRRSTVVCTSSADYAEHSRLHRLFATKGSMAVPATSEDRRGGVARYAVPGRRQIGFLGRPTSEKGIDTLMDALDLLPSDILLTLAGPLEGLSERVGYDRARLEELISEGRVRSLGFLAENEIADFYASLDLFVLPSTNSFEAFGIVQVEAMSAGTPVVASDLPGVRTIIQTTGFGEVANTGDSVDLARAIRVALESSYDKESARKILDSVYLSPRPEVTYREIHMRVRSD